jgi:hypothetical protein
MRRLGEVAEERRGRGRPRLFEDPVRVTVLMERSEYKVLLGHAEEQGRSLNEELRRRLAETVEQPQAS